MNSQNIPKHKFQYSNYAPGYSLDSSYSSAVGLRGGNPGIFPSQSNEQTFSLAATNFSSRDYQSMLSSNGNLQSGPNLVCDAIQRKMVDLRIKVDTARNEAEKQKAMEQYKKEAENAYNNSCAFPLSFMKPF